MDGALSGFLKAVQSMVPARDHGNSFHLQPQLSFSHMQENTCEFLRSWITLRSTVKVNFISSCYRDYGKSKLIVEFNATRSMGTNRAELVEEGPEST